MAIRNCTNALRPFRPYRCSAFRVLLFAGALAGLPAFAQPVPANAQQAQVLPALPTAAQLLAAVHAHPDVLITHAAYEEARANTLAAVQAHGDGSPQVTQAEEILALRREAWIAAVVDSYAQQINHLRNQGHTALELFNAYGNLNLFGVN